MHGKVLYTVRYDVHPGVGEEYTAWTMAAMARGMMVPGISELRVFQTAAGAPMINLCFEFASPEAWSGWCFHPEIQKIIEELTQFSMGLKNELWEPSPMLADPVLAAGADPASSCVRYLVRWDLLRETMDEYTSKAQGIWERALQVDGISGVSAYRAVAGSPRVMACLDFADLQAWARWYGNPVIHHELLTANSRYVVNTSTELWLPSPHVPMPIRAQ